MDTICNNCGRSLTAEDNFCPHCGKPISSSALSFDLPSNTPTIPAVPFTRTLPVPSTDYGSNPYSGTISNPYDASPLKPPPPPPQRQVKIGLLIVIAVLVAMLVGLGGFELGQLGKRQPQGNISSTTSPSNGSGTIPANTAQASTTLSPTQGCPISGGRFNIVNVNSGLVLDVTGGSLTSGTAIIQYPYNGGGLNQQWQFVSVGGGHFKIVNVNSGLVIDEPNGSLVSGTAIIQYPYNGGGLNLQWQCIPVGGGHFKIVNVNSGLVLDVPNTSLVEIAPLLQDPYNGGLYQQWKFVSI